MANLFIPPQPPRRAKPVHTLRGLFGERARTAVYGWSELAFNAWHIKRVVLGHPVHVVLKPEWVQRVLLDNAANYEKPRLVKRILAPTIGRGLLSSDGELWRAQRKIVAASFTPPAVDALVERFPEDEALELAVDNAATFYLAGHESTANTTAWTLYLLSEQPELQNQAAAEAQAALASGTDADLPDRLPLLRSILEESLRLYPPVPRFDREAVAADMLGEHEIRPGDLVSIWPWIIHRHKRLWDDPDVFDPQRFAPERNEQRHRFQYIPFGGGPRTCGGARLAMAEALTILAIWLATWRFKPVPGREVQVSGMVTLRPRAGCR